MDDATPERAAEHVAQIGPLALVWQHGRNDRRWWNVALIWRGGTFR